MYYEEVEGEATGSPVSPIIAHMYMEHLQEVALRATENPTRIWRRFVDDIFVVQLLEDKDDFLKHINSIDQSIKFIV